MMRYNPANLRTALCSKHYHKRRMSDEKSNVARFDCHVGFGFPDGFRAIAQDCQADGHKQIWKRSYDQAGGLRYWKAVLLPDHPSGY